MIPRYSTDHALTAEDRPHLTAADALLMTECPMKGGHEINTHHSAHGATAAHKQDQTPAYVIFVGDKFGSSAQLGEQTLLTTLKG